jgi:hypothetical protein
MMMIRRLMLCLAAAACAAVWGWSASAQGPACRYYKVQANSLNISKEARGDSLFIDVLDQGEIVCVTRDEKVGDRDWVYIAHKLPKPNEKASVEGWTNLRLLQPLSPAEIAAATGAAPAAAAPAASAPTAAAPPADDVLRFSQPVPFGPFPVNGKSIEELAKGVPQFPPFEGLEENLWKKNCASCHKWDRQTLCEQGASYAKNPRYALRISHPYGGFSSALMQWAKSGCQ